MQPETHTFDDDGAIPNSRLPLLIWRAALPADAEAIEQRFAGNRWPPAWRAGVYPYHHFHANTHEALGVARGTATVLFGGPSGREITVSAGDAVVIPAGVGHRAIRRSDDLLIVGAYPDNAPDPDQHRGDPATHGALVARIAAVPPPAADPVSGEDGALARLWGEAVPPRPRHENAT